MPNMTILTSNIAAALNQTKLSAADHDFLNRYTRETASGYCAGCTRICESASGFSVPIGDVMRSLMYHHSYGNSGLARSVFSAIPLHRREALLKTDYSVAESRCPQQIAIGKLMEEACVLFA
jgi:predicted aldo/keto reductase-like oxidoreductase